MLTVGVAVAGDEHDAARARPGRSRTVGGMGSRTVRTAGRSSGMRIMGLRRLQ
jgi:hypothetical protein